MNRSPGGVPPYAAFFAAVLLLVPVHLAVPIAQPLRFPATLIGLVPIALGLALGRAQARAMRRYAQGGLYADVPTRLITDGPFARSRNPLYLGMVLLTLGFALGLGSVGALAMVAVEVAVMDLCGIRFEERVLEKQFGEEYRDYRSRVRRWI